MKLYLPSKDEARRLLSRPERFGGLTVCNGALPPAFVLEAGIDPKSTAWLMPRLFCDELSQRIVGAGGFKSEPRGRSIEIGYGISPTCRRQGYATQGVLLLVQEAFSSGFIDEVVAETAKSNEPSRRVLVKAGFSANGSGIDSDGPVDRWLKRKPLTSRNEKA